MLSNFSQLGYKKAPAQPETKLPHLEPVGFRVNIIILRVKFFLVWLNLLNSNISQPFKTCIVFNKWNSYSMPTPKILIFILRAERGTYLSGWKVMKPIDYMSQPPGNLCQVLLSAHKQFIWLEKLIHPTAFEHIPCDHLGVCPSLSPGFILLYSFLVTIGLLYKFSIVLRWWKESDGKQKWVKVWGRSTQKKGQSGGRELNWKKIMIGIDSIIVFLWRMEVSC